jgi:hypothetical protein
MLIYGLDWFATLPPTIRLTTDKFGVAIGPLVFGWMFVAHQVGASAAAFGAGLTRTLDGTYAPAFALSGILCIVAGFASLAIDGNRNKGSNTVPSTSPRRSSPPFQAVSASASGAIPGKLGEITEDQFDRVIGMNLGVPC